MLGHAPDTGHTQGGTLRDTQAHSGIHTRDRLREAHAGILRHTQGGTLSEAHLARHTQGWPSGREGALRQSVPPPSGGTEKAQP